VGEVSLCGAEHCSEKEEIMTDNSKRIWTVVIAIAFLTIVIGFAFGAGQVEEQSESPEWPQQPIQIIVAWSAGGGTDRVARAIAPLLEEELGVPVAIVNRPGGTGVVGHTALSRARPDGYTIGMITPQLVTGPILGLTELSYDQFNLLALINEDAGSVTVNADSPWSTLPEFIEYAKENPARIRIGNSGPGGTQHMTAVTLERETGIDVIHTPYDGASPAITDLLGNHIEAVTASAVEVEPQVSAGLLRMLAILSSQRSASFPDVPTAAEQGFDIQVGTWRGLAAPAGLPGEVLARLTEAVHNAASDPRFLAYMEGEGFGARNLGPDDFETYIERQEKIYVDFYSTQ
jgi:tripartite-type tricarboxylate transporter receptor subunit TctC